MMTYVVLNTIFFLVLLVTLLTARGRVSYKAVALGLCIVVTLTAVFDPIMIAVGLVEYDASKLLGVYWFGAPIEDFAYVLFAVPFVAALWQILDRKTDV